MNYLDDLQIKEIKEIKEIPVSQWIGNRNRKK